MVIYIITNKVNSKVYIGKTVGSISERWHQHVTAATKGSNLLLHRAIRKFGVNNFEITTLTHVILPEELNDYERYFIGKYRSFPPELGFGYNMSPEGDGGPEIRLGKKQRPETKKKISEYKRMNPVVAGSMTAKKISKALIGRKFTPEWSQRKSVAQLGERNPMFGRTDHKPNLGRVFSDEWRSNLSAAAKRRRQAQ